MVGATCFKDQNHAGKKLHNFILFEEKRRLCKRPLPIYLRTTVDGMPKAISLKRIWDPNIWNKDPCRSIGLKQDAKELNELPDMITGKSIRGQTQAY